MPDVVASMVPPVMVKVPAMVPSADGLLIFKVPEFSVTPPVNVLAWPNVNEPVPL